MHTRTETNSQIRAQNLLLRNLFIYEDIYIVDTEEEFRIDVLVRDIVADGGAVAGHTISLYLFARTNWTSVGDTLLAEGKISQEERPVFDKMAIHAYFPLFFWSDYCTPDAMKATIERAITFIDQNFFEQTRPSATEPAEATDTPEPNSANSDD